MNAQTQNSQRVFFIIFSIIIFALFGLYFFFMTPSAKKPLPHYGTIHEFELIDSQGKKFMSDSLKNKVWIANFIFTTCAGPCPLMTKNLASVYRSYLLAEDVNFVSISANPGYDSPEVLKEYSGQYKADPDRWHFLTGPIETIKRLSVDEFKIGSKENPVNHSTFFVLVDRNFRIRGYYDGTQQSGVKQLFKDTALLLKEKQP